ncbi:MAG: transglutaminase domain-containing protein [Kofleriaceae bacterium]
MIRGIGHGLRVLAIAGAAFCVTSSITGTTGRVASVIGALAGIALGELLARRRIRMWFIGAAALVTTVVGLWLAAAATTYELAPDLFGPAMALRLSAILRFGFATFALVTVVRAAGRRIPVVTAVELVIVAAAFAIPFAAHRDGVIVRPLWLSDWAWRHGIDPSIVLLAIGATVAGSLALVMMLEAERRPTIASFAMLPALVILGAILFALAPTTKPREVSELGATKAERGDPPKPTMGSGFGEGQGSDGSAQGSNQRENQGSGQGGRPMPGQSGGSGQAQQQPTWQEPSEGSGGKDPVVAVVLLGDDYSPPTQAYYFRQEAWSAFSGPRLVPTRWAGVDLDIPNAARGSATPQVTETSPGMTLLHADVAMLVAQRKQLYLGAPTKWEPLTNPDPKQFVGAYRFEAVVPTLGFEHLVGHTAGDPAWSPEVLSYYLEASRDPRFGELAQQIVGELPEDRRADPFVKAAAIKQYLDANMTYSTKERHANVPDPTADFLFGNKIGYCVHFAHAAVFLWRSLGIPSRVAVGYYVEEEHRRGSSVLIRQSQAHAWPELYLEGVGWVILDISAERNLDPPGTPPDDEVQLQLAELARGSPPDPFDGPPVSTTGGRLGTIAAISGAVLIACALLILYGLKIWRRVAPRFAPAGELPRVGYRAALDALSGAGRARKVGETRERFAARVGDEVPAFVELTSLHLAARLGPAADTPPDRMEWRQLLSRLRAELAARAPAWRRVLAALNPISFRLSR